MILTDFFPRFGPPSVEEASAWTAAALAEAAALRTYDDRLTPTVDEPAKLADARTLRAAWTRWADEAEALLPNLRAAQAEGGEVERLKELRHAIGRARAMLQIKPDSALRAIGQAARGEGMVSFEEARTHVARRKRDVAAKAG